jgi:hypothetical protein
MGSELLSLSVEDILGRHCGSHNLHDLLRRRRREYNKAVILPVFSMLRHLATLKQVVEKLGYGWSDLACNTWSFLQLQTLQSCRIPASYPVPRSFTSFFPFA